MCLFKNILNWDNVLALFCGRMEGGCMGACG
jgi:hypothetical protein